MNTDKNKTTRTPTRLTVVLLLWSMTATTPLLITSCSHDDPATEEKANHRPGEGNNGSGGETVFFCDCAAGVRASKQSRFYE